RAVPAAGWRHQSVHEQGSVHWTPGRGRNDVLLPAPLYRTGLALSPGQRQLDGDGSVRSTHWGHRNQDVSLPKRPLRGERGHLRWMRSNAITDHSARRVRLVQLCRQRHGVRTKRNAKPPGANPGWNVEHRNVRGALPYLLAIQSAGWLHAAGMGMEHDHEQ